MQLIPSYIATAIAAIKRPAGRDFQILGNKLIGFGRKASLAAAPLADFDQAQIALAYQQFSDAFDKGTFFLAGPSPPELCRPGP